MIVRCNGVVTVLNKRVFKYMSIYVVAPGMMAPNLMLRRQKKEDEEFKVSLSYIVSLRP